MKYLAIDLPNVFVKATIEAMEQGNRYRPEPAEDDHSRRNVAPERQQEHQKSMNCPRRVTVMPYKQHARRDPETRHRKSIGERASCKQVCQACGENNQGHGKQHALDFKKGRSGICHTQAAFI